MPLGLRLETAFGEPRRSCFFVCSPTPSPGFGEVWSDVFYSPGLKQSPRWLPTGAMPKSVLLLTQVQRLQNRLVTFRCRALQVVQKAAAARDHAKKAAARVVIFHMSLEVLRELVDSTCQDRNLHVRASRILIVESQSFWCFGCHCF